MVCSRKIHQGRARGGTRRQRKGKSRRAGKRRTRKGGYTYPGKGRASRQSKKRTARATRVNSVTREIQKIVPKDPRFLKDLFESIDIDGSGGIDRDEFYKYFRTKMR